MDLNRLSILMLAVILSATLSGCEKSGPAAPSATTQNSAKSVAPSKGVGSQDLSQIHWLGKKRLTTETNAAGFMAIWNLPESAKLEAQTLDKLSQAPWRLLKGETATNDPATLLLRPLLNDLVEEESYAEIYHPKGQPGEFAFAIRLSDARSGLWETNLTSIVKSLTGLSPKVITDRQHSTELTKIDFLNHLHISRVGDWSVIGLARGTNSLMETLQARIKQSQNTFRTSPSNFWLEASVMLQQVATVLLPKMALPGELPRLEVTVGGNGTSVLTQGDLIFARPIPIALEDWSIPTNLLHEPLIGFSAVRGIRPLLSKFKPWNDLALGTPPNQAYFWAQAGGPWLHFMAFPTPNGSEQLSNFSNFVLHDLNPIFQTNRMGAFELSANSHRLRWRGVPFFGPTFEQMESADRPFMVNGFYPNVSTNPPPPNELFQQIYAATNLVWYDWELTQPCVQGLMPMLQLTRRGFGLPRLPGETAGLPWLQVAPLKLGNSVTIALLTRPNHLHFTRQSGMGLTAFELHAFVDWLESPEFPFGLHTFNAPRESQKTSSTP